MLTSENINRDRLLELCNKRLSLRRLILASNRAPVEYYRDDDGTLQSRRGSGGVVTALTNLSQYVEMDWIASAMGEGDREVARNTEGGRIKLPSTGEKLYLRFVTSPRRVYHKFYNVFCNPLLWFLQHYMWDSSRAPNIDHVIYDAWENGYLPVNRAFAQAVVDTVALCQSSPLVLLNDYHLYMASSYIREQLPDQVIQSFIHIPWPSTIYWQLLPKSMREPILRSLCTSDIVGLQTMRDVRNFCDCCRSFISEARINFEQQTVQINGHTVLVRAYPISVDTAALNSMTSTPALQQYLEKLKGYQGEQTIVRVDRLEPSKNIVRGFRAFDSLLERYPEFVGKLKFLAFLVPTRTHLKAYQRYSQEVFGLIEDINNKYRTGEWYPIDLFYENNYTQAIAGMCLYDVLLVNAVLDGMNLVAKEGPTVNFRDGVLILSEAVGACEQLGENALTVSPADLEGTTQALYRALTMPTAERRQRATALKQSIEAADLTNWLFELLGDSVSLIEQRS